MTTDDQHTPSEAQVRIDCCNAAEHRATRAEARAEVRGRAVAIYRKRAREAEASRDEWRQTALDERGAALDALEQIKARDTRIKAVRELHAEVEGLHCHTVCSHRSCIDDSGDQHRYPCPTIRALEG